MRQAYRSAIGESGLLLSIEPYVTGQLCIGSQPSCSKSKRFKYLVQEWEMIQKDTALTKKNNGLMAPNSWNH